MRGSFSEEVPLGRLRSLMPAERDLYVRLFASAGGGPDTKVPGQQAAQFLQRTQLPQEALRHIWDLADNTKQGALDVEGFCVACRLCAHAQQAPNADAAARVLSEAAIARAPTVPPHFEGFEASGLGGGGLGGDGYANDVASPTSLTSRPRLASNDFDFEAAAFGAEVPPLGATRSKPPVLGQGEELACSKFGGVAPWWHDGARSGRGATALGRSRGGPERTGGDGLPADDDVQPWGGPMTAPKLAEAFSGELAALARGDEAALEHPVSAMLGRELVLGRKEIDSHLSEKSRLEQLVERARSRLRDCHERRQATVGELTRRRGEVDQSSASLEFSRRRIEDIEREIADLREARGAYSAEDLRRAAADAGAGADGLAHGHDAAMPLDASAERGQVRTAARAARRSEAEDHRAVAELIDKARRASRRKLDLQARQQLLLEDQRQAEQDRGYLRKSLDEERARLSAIQTDRLLLGEERLGVLQEVGRLARKAGLGPGAVSEVLRALPGFATGGGARDDATEDGARPRGERGHQQQGKAASGDLGGSAQRVPFHRSGYPAEGEGEGGAWLKALSRPRGEFSATDQQRGQAARWQSFGGSARVSDSAEKDLEMWQHRRQSLAAPPAG